MTHEKQTEIPQTENRPQPSPAQALVVLPPAFESHDKELKQEQLQFACELGAKYPKIVTAAQALRENLRGIDTALTAAGDLYRSLVTEVHAAKLNRRESTLLLRGLGMAGNRISEVLRVAELPAGDYNRYIKGEMGFKAVLALDTAKKKAGGKDVKAGKKAAKKPRIIIHDLGDKNAQILRDAIGGMSRLLKGGTTTEWAHAFVSPQGKFYVAITASPKDAPVAEETTEE